MSTHMERIQALDSIEKEIITCIQSAGQALQELSKDKSNLKQAETQTNQFLKTLNHVESRLNEQINYLTQVSTGQPHEGSGYASGKTLQMAWHRFEHVRVRIKELDTFKSNQMQVWTMEMNKRNAAAAAQNAAMTPMQSQQIPQQGVENVNQQS